MDSLCLPRQANEGYYDYLSRLFENKIAYSLDCNEIARLMNEAFNRNCGESKYRKEYKAFSAGRKYERETADNKVGNRILSISDLHVPYQLPVETFAEYAGKVDALVLNGDLVDHQAISKFPKMYRINPIEEIIECRQYLIELINIIRPTQVFANVGNHEARFASYLAKNLDSEIKELMPDNALDLIFVDGFHHYNKREHTKIWFEPICNLFESIEITYTGEWKCKIGKTWFAHPLTFSGSTLKTCEKAMDYFFKTDPEPFDAVCLGHTHRTGDVRKGKITLYEQGACCQTERMNYGNGKLCDPQQKGFVLISQDKEGNLLYDKSKRIIL